MRDSTYYRERLQMRLMLLKKVAFQPDGATVEQLRALDLDQRMARKDLDGLYDAVRTEQRARARAARR